MKKHLFLALLLISQTSFAKCEKSCENCVNPNWVGPFLAGMRCEKNSDCRSGVCFYDESKSRTGTCNAE